MLSLPYLRENKETALEGLSKRNFKTPEAIEEILEKDKERRNIQSQLDTLLAQSNQLAREIGTLFKSGKVDQANALKEETASLKETTKTLQEALQVAESQLFDIRTTVPNIPHKSVPNGQTEDDNEEVYRSGDIPKLAADALPHWELASKYDLIDFELGSKISGAGFPVYKGKGARLQRGLINYFLDKNTAAGYREMQVPHVVNEASGFGTGQLPDKEGQMYHVQIHRLR